MQEEDGTACDDHDPTTTDDKCSQGHCFGVDKCKVRSKRGPPLHSVRSY